MSNSSEIVLDVNHVWKVYCRNLKRAMWYGVRDLGREMTGQGHDRTITKLRPGEFFAIKDATFQVRQGECVALIGPNGAGKSTMLKMINGLVRPDAGKISIRGKVAALIELGTGFNPILSGRENIYINAAVLGIGKREVDRIIDKMIDFAELDHVIDDPVKTYSSGMRIRLGFSVAANLRPNLLIMDEVLAVGDVGFRMKCFSHLRDLINEGVSIIVVTHAVTMLRRVATRSVVFGNGKIVFDGDLPTGSTIYEEMMNVPSQSTEKRDEKDAGTKARIDDVTVLNEQGQPQLEFETGETLRLQIQLSASEEIRDARVIAAMCSPVHGKVASMSTAYQDFQMDLQSGQRTIYLEFPKLPLLIGAYHFNISLYGSKETDFHQRRTIQGNFRIVGPPLLSDGRGLGGIFKLPHRWGSD